MTEPFDEYGDRLRRALHAEADAVVPSAEGLEQIRTKIAKKRERRLGPFFRSGLLAHSWVRPLAALGAAALIAIVALSTTPAIRNFVQTGHFSSDDGSSGQGNGGSRPGGQNPGGPGGPGGTDQSLPSANPTSPTSPGTPRLYASCPPGQVAVQVPRAPQASPDVTGSASETSKVTCKPGSSTSASATAQPPDTSASSSPTSQPPTDKPSTESSSQPSP